MFPRIQEILEPTTRCPTWCLAIFAVIMRLPKESQEVVAIGHRSATSGLILIGPVILAPTSATLLGGARCLLFAPCIATMQQQRNGGISRAGGCI